MGTSDESFRGLLLRHRGRIGLTQSELAARARVSVRSVQDWEAGAKFPTAERLQALLRVLLEAGGLTAGQERSEAHALWKAAELQAPRMHTSFDDKWFAGLLAHASSQPRQQETEALDAPLLRVESAEDWGEAPDTLGFVGRADELALLSRWVLEERSRLVAVLGIGGIGKTSLASKLAHSAAPSFERVYWRSLRNVPPVSEWLAGAIGFLSDQQMVVPPTESERVVALLQLLRANRCMLVLDNYETLFEPGQLGGEYQTGMGGYGSLLRAVGDSSHQSCVMLTSREVPPEVAELGGGVRSLEIHGFATAEAQTLLADKQLRGDAQAWMSLVDRLGGNGLALKIVGETIRQVFDGDVAMFLEDPTDRFGIVFGGIRRLLDGQLERLSHAEHDVLTRLAVEREPIALAELSTSMRQSLDRSTVIQAIETLRRRSLVERGARAATFTLQSMVLQYVTDRLVETATDEIERGQAVLLVEQPLIKALAKDYVRQTQERLIGTPILQRLLTRHSQRETESHLLALLDTWRGRSVADQGYGPGNVVNLLRLLRGDIRHMDLSKLALRQLYLQGVDAQDTSLAGAHLTEAILTEAFAYATAVALSADGELLAAGTPTGEVRLWRVADRTPLLSVPAHTGAVPRLSFSSDARRLASFGVDGVVMLWETASGRLLATLRADAGVLITVALSPDGRLVASGGMDGVVRLWEALSGQLLASLRQHTGVVLSVAFSGDGRLLASGGWDGTVNLWEMESGELRATLRGHTGVVQDVALSNDGRLLVSGGDDGMLMIWDARMAEPLQILRGHTGVVWRVELSGNERLLASASFDGTVKLWEVESGRLLATLQRHTGAVRGVALSKDARLVASGGDDGRIMLWETRTGQLLTTMHGHTGVVWSVAQSEDGRLAASGSWDGMVRLWEPGSGQLLATLRHMAVVRGVALSGDGRLVASGGDDGTVRLWETRSGVPVAAFEGHTAAVWGVALSTDGRLVVSGSWDGSVRLWAIETRQPLTGLHGNPGQFSCVALSGDGRLIATGGNEGLVNLWEAASGQLVGTLRGHTAVVRSVALSGDGRLVASGDSDGTVRLWESNSGQLLHTLRRQTGLVRALALSGDGRRVASGSWDGTVRLWDTATGQQQATLLGHAGAVWCVALSRDGQLAASGGDDGTVRLWEPESGDCLRVLRSDRQYQRLDITGLTGVTEAQRTTLLGLGAIEQPAPTRADPHSSDAG
jgi:WD40 repeat protein/transcriptional regulator with XRE-family HTH domain